MYFVKLLQLFHNAHNLGQWLLQTWDLNKAPDEVDCLENTVLYLYQHIWNTLHDAVLLFGNDVCQPWTFMFGGTLLGKVVSVFLSSAETLLKRSLRLTTCSETSVHHHIHRNTSSDVSLLLITLSWDILLMHLLLKPHSADTNLILCIHYIHSWPWSSTA